MMVVLLCLEWKPKSRVSRASRGSKMTLKTDLIKKNESRATIDLEDFLDGFRVKMEKTGFVQDPYVFNSEDFKAATEANYLL